MAMIEVEDLTRTYRSRSGVVRRRTTTVEALLGISFEVERGELFGLLGPNGAGKTTAVRILTTLLPPSAGTASVMGLDVVDDAAALRAQIGLAGQNAAVDENLTGFENLEMVGRLYHLTKARSSERARELLKRFELDEAADRLVRTYSGGMRRRLDLAAALVADPPVIFLDEPTTGLDPRSRLALWETIEAMVSEGTTVLLTTQYLDEADRLADRIAVLDKGEVIAEGTSDELKDRVGGERIEITLGDHSQAGVAVRILAEVSREEPKRSDGIVSVPLDRERTSITDVVRRLDGAGVQVEDLAVRRPTLDDVFLSLTGHVAEEKPEDEGDGEQ